MTDPINIAWTAIVWVFAGLGAASSAIAVYEFVRARYRRAITWKNAMAAAETLLEEIEALDWRPDLVIGLGRSGAIFGGWLAGNLGSVPVYTFDRRFDDNSPVRQIEYPLASDILALMRGKGPVRRKILLVEGASSSGKTVDRFLGILHESWPEADVRTASLYTNVGASTRLDFVARRDFSPWPEQFPWHLRRVYKRFIGRRP